MNCDGSEGDHNMSLLIQCYDAIKGKKAICRRGNRRKRGERYFKKGRDGIEINMQTDRQIDR